MRVAALRLRALLPLLISWLMAALFPFLPSVSKWQTLPPEVPYLLSVPQPGALPGHVRSSVFFFIVAVGAGLVCAFPLEFSKMVVAREPAAIRLYVAFVTQQVVVMLDVIRSYAWDWWRFLLSMTRIRPIDEWSWMERHATIIGRWPWPSAVSAILVVVLFLIVSRPGSPNPAAG